MNIDRLSQVPSKPGVYLWKNKNGNILYVGKAKDLNNRMKQYFRGMNNSYKTQKLVSRIDDFEYIITPTEQDALILERNLIEKYFPEFNIKLLDNKRYPYIKIKLLKNKLEVKLAYRVRELEKQANFYGPFPSGFGARRMSNLVNRLTTYKNGLPYESDDLAYWKEQYKVAKEILSFKSGQIIRKLKKQMIDASNNMQFEVADDIKKTLDVISEFKEGQSVEMLDEKNIDVIAFFENKGHLSIGRLFYRNGILLSNSTQIVEITNSKAETISQYISQYYAHNLKPDYIISNHNIDFKDNVIVPKKGQKKKILNIAIENAKDNIDQKLFTFLEKEKRLQKTIINLEKLIGIKSALHILMIDNSNTNNTDPISAIVSYRNGIKQPMEYRKYSLQVNERKADVDYMSQGVKKYFANESNAIPDLLILDGGVAQINEVKSLVPKGIKVIGLVKDDNHRTKEIISDGKRIEISDKNLYNFLSSIQIEVDRYAKAFHRKKRISTLEGTLSRINGVGKKTEEKLLSHFKTYSAIYNSSVEELSKVVSKNVAKRIAKGMGKEWKE